MSSIINFINIINLVCCCQGIEYLIEHGLLQNTAEDVARFLFQGEGLNKTAIGDYLGERLVEEHFSGCLVFYNIIRCTARKHV